MIRFVSILLPALLLGAMAPATAFAQATGPAAKVSKPKAHRSKPADTGEFTTSGSRDAMSAIVRGTPERQAFEKNRRPVTQGAGGERGGMRPSVGNGESFSPGMNFSF